MPLVCGETGFSPDATSVAVRTDAFLNHVVERHPITWDGETPTVPGKVWHDVSDWECEVRRATPGSVTWPMDGSARCGLCRLGEVVSVS